MSRFAGLRIEDDSEEDEFTAMVKGAKKIGGAKGNPKGKGGPAPASKARARPKATAHKTKKAAEATAEEWEAMDAKLQKDQFQRDLAAAIEASRITAAENAMISAALAEDETNQSQPPPSVAQPKGKKKKKATTTSEDGPKAQPNPASSSSSTTVRPQLVQSSGDAGLNSLAAQTEAEVGRILRSEEKGKVDTVLLSLYRAKLEEASAEMETLRAGKAAAEAEAEKYKGRYKKLCELLKDAEVKEKAQLLVELEKSTALRQELGEEMAELSAQLAQATSRLANYEGKGSQE